MAISAPKKKISRPPPLSPCRYPRGTCVPPPPAPSSYALSLSPFSIKTQPPPPARRFSPPTSQKQIENIRYVHQANESEQPKEHKQPPKNKKNIYNFETPPKMSEVAPACELSGKESGTRFADPLLKSSLRDFQAGNGSQTEFRTPSPKVREPHFHCFGFPEQLLKMGASWGFRQSPSHCTRLVVS